jgi:hypothetical protein
MTNINTATMTKKYLPNPFLTNSLTDDHLMAWDDGKMYWLEAKIQVVTNYLPIFSPFHSLIVVNTLGSYQIVGRNTAIANGPNYTYLSNYRNNYNYNYSQSPLPLAWDSTVVVPSKNEYLTSFIQSLPNGSFLFRQASAIATQKLQDRMAGWYNYPTLSKYASYNKIDANGRVFS